MKRKVKSNIGRLEFKRRLNKIDGVRAREKWRAGYIIGIKDDKYAIALKSLLYISKVTDIGIGFDYNTHEHILLAESRLNSFKYKSNPEKPGKRTFEEWGKLPSGKAYIQFCRKCNLSWYPSRSEVKTGFTYCPSCLQMTDIIQHLPADPTSLIYKHIDSLRLNPNNNRPKRMTVKKRQFKKAKKNPEGELLWGPWGKPKKPGRKPEKPGKRTFEEWKKQVNSWVERLAGVSCDDLPDYEYYGAYAVGESPKETARDVIDTAKGEYGLENTKKNPLELKPFSEHKKTPGKTGELVECCKCGWPLNKAKARKLNFWSDDRICTRCFTKEWRKRGQRIQGNQPHRLPMIVMGGKKYFFSQKSKELKTAIPRGTSSPIGLTPKATEFIASYIKRGEYKVPKHMFTNNGY